MKIADSRPLTLLQLNLKARPLLRKLLDLLSLVINAAFSPALVGRASPSINCGCLLHVPRYLLPHFMAINTSQESWPQTHTSLRFSAFTNPSVFAHQRHQSLCLHTPSSSFHLLRKGLEGPTYGISIEEMLSGHPSRSNGLGRY